MKPMDNTEIIQLSFTVEVPASVDRKMLVDYLHDALLDAERDSQFTLVAFVYSGDVTIDE